MNPCKDPLVPPDRLEIPALSRVAKMRIGEWEARSCLASKFRLDGGAMFGVVPKTLWSKNSPADEKNRISMVMRPLLLTGGGKTVLVDTGSGTGYGEKYEKIYGFEDAGSLTIEMKTLGVSPGDVTDVVITHLHFDHAGGIVDPIGDEWKLLFPNAVHHVQKAQYDHALNPNPRDRASYFRERIEIMEKEKVLELHEGEWTLYPNLDILTCHGHTPGMQLMKVSDGDENLLYCADLIPTAAHLPVPYIMSYDLDPLLAMKEKEPILEKACEENWILFFEHDPSVIACYIERKNGRFVPGERVDL